MEQLCFLENLPKIKDFEQQQNYIEKQFCIEDEDELAEFLKMDRRWDFVGDQMTHNQYNNPRQNNQQNRYPQQVQQNYHNNGYMDIFNQHSVGDLSSAVSYSSFINQNATSTSASMLPPHLSQHSSAVPNNSSRLSNGIAIKSEPQVMHPAPSPPQPLSAAVSALTAAAMQSGGYQQTQIMHQQSQQMQNPAHGSCAPHLNHQQPTTSNRYTSHHGLDMDDQEKKKLERKRARNRAAASKCRQRKLERIQELEGQVQQERQQNAQLQLTIEKAREDLQRLRNSIEEHRHAGCVIPLSFN